VSEKTRERERERERERGREREREGEREREKKGERWEPEKKGGKRDEALRAAKVHWPKEKRNTV